MYLLVNTVKITNFMQSISLTEEVALDASQVVCPSVKIVLSMLADRDYWGDFPCSLHMNNGTTLFDGTLDKESVEYDYAKDTISFEVVSDIKEIMQKEVSADYGTHYYEYWRDEKTGIVSIYSSRQAALEWLFKMNLKYRENIFAKNGYNHHKKAIKKFISSEKQRKLKLPE